MAKLTERAIAALVCQPGKKDRLVFDDAMPGLGVRIASTGAKAFLAQYTLHGSKRRVPLGRWGAITLEQARTAARAVLGDVAKGQDVAAIKRATTAETKAAARVERLTLKVLLSDWERLSLMERRESYRREALRALKFAFPVAQDKPAAALTRETVLGVLDKLTKAGNVAMAGRTLAYGRACYSWARKREMVAVNPFDDLPISTRTEARDRVLTDDELRAIWRHAGALGASFDALFQLLLLTAQRRDEVGAMRWSELSADRWLWTIPKERAKNGRAHVVHLVPAAQAILARVKRVGKSDLVFTTTGKTPVSGFTRAKNRLDAAIAKERCTEGKPAPLPGWRLHDFRRSVVTWMAGNGVAPHVADRLLNHVTGTISGVAAIYQRGEFLAERKVALEAWAIFVTSSKSLALIQ